MLALFGSIGMPEIILLAIVGLLLFGKRLPEVGRSIGKGIVEFKKGLAGIEDEVDRASKGPRDAGQTKRIEDQRAPSVSTSTAAAQDEPVHRDAPRRET